MNPQMCGENSSLIFKCLLNPTSRLTDWRIENKILHYLMIGSTGVYENYFIDEHGRLISAFVATFLSNYGTTFVQGDPTDFPPFFLID